MPEDGDSTATRMAKEAAQNHAETVQEIIDEVGASHAGARPGQVKEALESAWADKLPDGAPPLPADKAAEYAEHISRDRNVVVVPVEPQLIPPDKE